MPKLLVKINDKVKRKRECEYVRFLFKRCNGKTTLCNTYYNLLYECKKKKFIFKY